MKKIFLFFVLIMSLFSVVYATDDIDFSENEMLEVLYENDENIEYSDEIYSDFEYLDLYENMEYKYLKGRVEEAGEIYTEENDFYTFSYQDVKVIIEDGSFNTVKSIRHSLSYYTGLEDMSKPLKKGDRVIVYASILDDEIVEAAISEKDNSIWLITILGLYAVVIIVIGGKKGLKALISLIITILAVFYWILPRLIRGDNPLVVTTIVSIVITLVALFIISGINKKAVVAIAGTTGGIIISAAFAIIFGSVMGLSGINEEAGTLSQQMVYGNGTQEVVTYDFKGLLYAGIIIGALGACMDVSMSIASALHELKEESSDISVKRMMKAGMNIGKDMMGTMTNTLILAYMGGSMVLVMLLMVTGDNFRHIINSEMLLEEILRAIAGSFGLVTTIPFTTLVGSLMMGKR